MANAGRVLETIKVLTAAGSLLVGAPALAQNSGNSSPPADQGSGGTADQTQNVPGADQGLQEVVVTAERREQDVQSVPIVIATMSGAQALEDHVNNISDLQATAPSLTDDAQSGGFYQNVNIRGIGETALSAPQIPPGVAIYRDGLLQGEITGLEGPLYDIADTEVLQGPQGTLGGGSSVGGSIQINSANPNFNGSNGFVDTQLGSYQDKRVDGAVNLQATDTLAFRVAFNGELKNSFYRDEGALNVNVGNQNPIVDPGSTQDTNLRLGMLWKPTDAFQALVKYEYDFMNYGGSAGEPNPTTFTTLFGGASCSANGPNGSVVCPGAGIVEHNAFYYAGEEPFVLQYASTNQEYREQDQRYSADLRYTLPDQIVLRSLTGMQRQDVDEIYWQSYGPINDGTNYHELGPDDDYFSEELNVISPTNGNLNWIAGAFWFYRSTAFTENTPTFAQPYTTSPAAVPTVLADVALGSKIRTASAFGNMNWQFTSTLQLQLGVRENWDNNINFVEPGEGVYLYAGAPPNTFPGTPVDGYDHCATGGSRIACIINTGYYRDAVTTGKADLTWTPTPQQHFYVFFAKGYKSGGSNGNPNTPYPTFKPEQVNDYEIGWKGELLENHIIAQLGGYWMDYMDMQYPVYNFYSPSASGTPEDENLSPSTIKGIEASMQSKFDHLDFNFGLDYNDTALGTYSALNSAELPAVLGFGTTSAPAQCPSSGPVKGCFNYLPYVQSFGGEPNAFSPKITLNAAVDYGFPMGNYTLRPRVTYSYTSSQYAALFETPYYYMPARGLWGANIDFDTGPWLVSLYGTNLANKVYVASMDTNNVYYGAPRQWGLRVDYSFGGTPR